jgi:hypothetical protein
MYKKVRTMTLHRETLRLLTISNLKEVAGDYATETIRYTCPAETCIRTVCVSVCCL